MRRARTPAERRSLLATSPASPPPRPTCRRACSTAWNPPRVPEILPNCIDLAALPPPAPRENVLLFAGRVVADKGADAFVAACARRCPACRAGGPRSSAPTGSAPPSRKRRSSPTLPRRRRCRGDAARLPAARPGARRARAGRHRRRAQPLAGAVRHGRAGGDGLRCAAALLRPRRARRGRRRCRRHRRSGRSRRPRRRHGGACRRPRPPRRPVRGRPCPRAAPFDVEAALARRHVLRRAVVGAWLRGDARPI